jgi:hypothetical protein
MKEPIRGDRVCFRPLDGAPPAAASPQPLVYFPRSAEKYMPNSEHEKMADFVTQNERSVVSSP